VREELCSKNTERERGEERVREGERERERECGTADKRKKKTRSLAHFVMNTIIKTCSCSSRPTTQLVHRKRKK
jgi:hypothetical protein